MGTSKYCSMLQNIIVLDPTILKLHQSLPMKIGSTVHHSQSIHCMYACAGVCINCRISRKIAQVIIR